MCITIKLLSSTDLVTDHEFWYVIFSLYFFNWKMIFWDIIVSLSFIDIQLTYALLSFTEYNWHIILFKVSNLLIHCIYILHNDYQSSVFLNSFNKKIYKVLLWSAKYSNTLNLCFDSWQYCTNTCFYVVGVPKHLSSSSFVHGITYILYIYIQIFFACWFALSFGTTPVLFLQKFLPLLREVSVKS